MEVVAQEETAAQGIFQTLRVHPFNEQAAVRVRVHRATARGAQEVEQMLVMQLLEQHSRAVAAVRQVRISQAVQAALVLSSYEYPVLLRQSSQVV
jgi:hypothetical protein